MSSSRRFSLGVQTPSLFTLLWGALICRLHVLYVATGAADVKDRKDARPAPSTADRESASGLGRCISVPRGGGLPALAWARSASQL